MSTIRRFCCNDLLRLGSVHLDHFATTTKMKLYMQWLVKWPNYSQIAIAPGNRIMGYIIGGLKEKPQDEEHWHGLAIFVNVASEYRMMKLGKRLMLLFEKQIVEKMRKSKRDDHHYMYLYVVVSNTPAARFFIRMGYQVINVIPNFYFKRDENAFEMAKEIAEETPTRGVVRNIELCSFCKERKQDNCSYVCLPRIV